jgi:hypothetical protein
MRSIGQGARVPGEQTEGRERAGRVNVRSSYTHITRSILQAHVERPTRSILQETRYLWIQEQTNQTNPNQHLSNPTGGVSDLSIPSTAGFLAHSQPPRPIPHVSQHGHKRPPILSHLGGARTGIHPFQPRRPQHRPAHRPPADRPCRRQQRGDPIPAVQQDLERLDVVGHDRPAEGTRGRGHVVFPNDHEDGEQLGGGGDEERGGDGVGARVAGEDAEQGERGEARGGQEADGAVECEGAECAEHEEEEVLVDDGLLGEPAKVGVGVACRVGVAAAGGLAALDARPSQVDVEEEEEDTEADDGGLGT